MNTKIDKRINRLSLSEQLSDILQELITNGTYKNGDKLPTEMELTELYNVSRLTVRSALQRLNALGLVVTKAGDGTYVTEFKVDNYLIDVHSMIQQPKMLDDIRNFRKVVDVECIRLAIENATDDEIEEIKDACNIHTAEYYEKKDVDDDLLRLLAEEDYNIHMTITKLSKNSMFLHVYNTSKDLLVEYAYTISSIRHRRAIELNTTKFIEGVIRSHHSLYDAIKKRDFTLAKKYYLNHIDYSVLHLMPEDF